MPADNNMRTRRRAKLLCFCILSKYALPVMWKLLESSSSASTGSGNMKEAVHGLANLLYSLMGQSLFEQAQAKSHRLRQKLKELLDQRLDQ